MFFHELNRICYLPSNQKSKKYIPQRVAEGRGSKTDKKDLEHFREKLNTKERKEIAKE